MAFTIKKTDNTGSSSGSSSINKTVIADKTTSQIKISSFGTEYGGYPNEDDTPQSIDSLANTINKYGSTDSTTSVDNSTTETYASLIADEKTALKAIQTNEDDLAKLRQKAEYTLALCGMYQLYDLKLKTAISDYQTAAKISKDIASDSSNINVVLAKLNSNITNYLALTNKDTDNAEDQKTYLSNINSLYASYQKDLENLNITGISGLYIPDSAKIESNGLYTAYSSTATQFKVSNTISIDNLNIFSATLRPAATTGVIGQDVTIYIAVYLKFNSIIYVSIPQYGINNMSFEFSTKVNCYRNYMTTTENTHLLYFESSDGYFDVTSTTGTLKFQYDESSTAISATYNQTSITDFFNKGAIITCIKDSTNTALYNTTRLSDSVKIKLISDFGDKTDSDANHFYGVGTLDRLASKSIDNTTYYTGSVTVSSSSSSITSTTTKKIICTIKYITDKSKYNISIYPDSEDSSNNTTSFNTDTDIATSFMINDAYNARTPDTEIDTSQLSDTALVYHVLLSIGKLASAFGGTIADNNLACTEFIYMYSLFDNDVSYLYNDIITNLRTIKTISNSISLSISVLSAEDSSYCDDYCGDISTALSSLATDAETYSSDSLDTDSVYDGTIYNAFSSDYSDLTDALLSVLTDVTNSINEMNSLLDNLSLVTSPSSSTEINPNISEVLKFLSNILNKQNTSISTYISSGSSFISYPVDDYTSWCSSFTNNIASSSDIDQNLIDLLYLYSVINRAISNSSSTDDDLINTWKKLYNNEVLYIIKTYGLDKTLNIEFNSYNQGNKWISNLIHNENNLLLNSGFEYDPDPNSYKINPYLTSISSYLQKFNNIDVEEICKDKNQNYYDYIATYKSIVYAMIVSLPSSEIKSTLNKIGTFFAKKSTDYYGKQVGLKCVNLREAICAECVKEVNDDLINSANTTYLKYAMDGSVLNDMIDSKTILDEYFAIYYAYNVQTVANETEATNMSLPKNFLNTQSAFYKILINGISD